MCSLTVEPVPACLDLARVKFTVKYSTYCTFHRGSCAKHLLNNCANHIMNEFSLESLWKQGKYRTGIYSCRFNIYGITRVLGRSEKAPARTLDVLWGPVQNFLRACARKKPETVFRG